MNPIAAIASSRKVIVGICVALLLAHASVGAQDVRVGLTTQPTFQRWELADTIVQGNLRVASVEQYSILWAFALPMSEDQQWVLDASGAYAWGRIGGGSGQQLHGPTDVRVRLYGPLVHDHLLLTLGLNGPSGTTELRSGDVDKLAIIGAPALNMTVPFLGLGLGGSAGLVLAGTLAHWGVAVGGTYEVRRRYTPEQLLIGAQRQPIELDPSDAVHLSLGVDGLVGPHRAELVVTTDALTQSRLFYPLEGRETGTWSYRPGNTVSIHGQVNFAAPRFRVLSAGADFRQRSGFKDADERVVPSSRGTVYLAFGQAVLGSPRGVGLIGTVELRHESGLGVDDSFVTAAANVRSLTGGISIPVGTAFVEPFVRLSIGRFDLGPQATDGKGVTYGLRLVPR